MVESDGKRTVRRFLAACRRFDGRIRLKKALHLLRVCDAQGDLRAPPAERVERLLERERRSDQRRVNADTADIAGHDAPRDIDGHGKRRAELGEVYQEVNQKFFCAVFSIDRSPALHRTVKQREKRLFDVRRAQVCDRRMVKKQPPQIVGLPLVVDHGRLALHGHLTPVDLCIGNKCGAAQNDEQQYHAM